MRRDLNGVFRVSFQASASCVNVRLPSSLGTEQIERADAMAFELASASERIAALNRARAFLVAAGRVAAAYQKDGGGEQGDAATDEIRLRGAIGAAGFERIVGRAQHERADLIVLLAGHEVGFNAFQQDAY
jgi:hypothetical protein